jgi:hypothetical protein
MGLNCLKSLFCNLPEDLNLQGSAVVLKLDSKKQFFKRSSILIECDFRRLTRRLRGTTRFCVSCLVSVFYAAVVEVLHADKQRVFIQVLNKA